MANETDLSSAFWAAGTLNVVEIDIGFRSSNEKAKGKCLPFDFVSNTAIIAYITIAWC